MSEVHEVTVKKYNTTERYQNDPEFRRKMIDAVNRSIKKRYAENPEFREKNKAYHRERYHLFEKEKKHEHYEANKEKVKQTNKAYYQRLKECKLIVDKMQAVQIDTN